MNTILVTGRNGFIANELVQVLKKNHKIISIIRSRKPHVDYSQEELVISDLQSLMLEQLRHVSIDVIIHAAAMINGVPKILERHNIETSKRIFDIARQLKAPVVFFSSTNAVFSEVLGAYARSKRACEEKLQNSGLKYLILRIPFVVGANAPTIKAIKNFYKKFSFLPLFGPQRGETHIVNIAAIINFVVEKIRQGHFAQETVNLIGRKAYIYPEIIEHVLNRKVLFFILPYSLSLKACQFFELLGLPFPISSEHVKSLNLDKILAGDREGKTIFVGDEVEVFRQ